jgi:hypothetical protein
MRQGFIETRYDGFAVVGFALAWIDLHSGADVITIPEMFPNTAGLTETQTRSVVRPN